ncbi:MAG: Tex family protein [Bacilli bacterium]|nr:Tex family protein [Bacilli bacterium]MDD4623989.1 Tex family protein [Bacilli bacterium]
MNDIIIEQMRIALGISTNQIETVLKLLEDGNTIPFIARYRKEMTRNLDEEQIKSINEVYEYQVNLMNKKENIIKLIDEKGMLTEEIKQNILNCQKLVEVEDIYRPYKEKKKTKASEAIKNGLEPLAKYIMTFPKEIGNLNNYLNENIKSEIDAIQGAKDIIAEWISDNSIYRKWIRSYIYSNGLISSKKKKDSKDEERVYEMYYDYKESLKTIKPHRILAVNRGEKEKVLNIKIDVEDDKILEYLYKENIKIEGLISSKYVKEAIDDGYKRLIFPSIEREIRSELTDEANEQAIKIFSNNLENLLLQPPMKEKVVLGLDPAFRTGCKLAVIDKTGKFLEKSVIYPHEPINDIEKSTEELNRLVDKYKVDIISIGNGTASRESEKFVSNYIQDHKKDTKYIIVNEAGASVYSASKLAIDEFPNLHVEERSAISIARRLQDPLSELVKVEPKSIGVGQYQHDVPQNRLNDSLDFVVSKAVNLVGVNINTASQSLLKYVSGLNKKNIENIIEYRNKKGKIESRKELERILNDKIYQQSIGFMRIMDGTNPLDKTSIHPESYSMVTELLSKLELQKEDLGSSILKEKLDKINRNEYKIDEYTFNDIISSLKQPLRDLRDDFKTPILKSNILTIQDLTLGMKLQGTVRNVVDFGLFIDIGLKNDGLAHISKLSNKYIKHPSDLFNVGDIVDCYVDEIYLDKNKVSLSLIEK